MIRIARQPFDVTEILNEYPEGSMERQILKTMADSDETLSYNSVNQLKFELRMRKEIINASNALYRSRLAFRIFRDSFCNEAYWNRLNDGGFALKEGVKPRDAILDIFTNTSKYGTECATAMVIIYYKALVEIFPEEAFNSIFDNIHLMNWNRIEPELREIGYIRRTNLHLPGDRRYFANPDVDPITPEWQGENVIDLGNGLYYGHGIGLHKPEVFIEALNGQRREGSDRSAYLMDTVSNPNYQRLSDLYDRYTAAR